MLRHPILSSAPSIKHNFWQMETRIGTGHHATFLVGHIIWLAGGCSARDVGVDKVTSATTLLDTQNTSQESSFPNELQSVCWEPVATCLLQQELSSCTTKFTKSAILTLPPKQSPSLILVSCQVSQSRQSCCMRNPLGRTFPQQHQP